MRFLFFIGILLASVLFSCSSKKTVAVKNNSGTEKYTNKHNKHTSTTAKKSSPTSVSGYSYIDQYKDIAIREMNQYGIPASIKLAQALLESANGNSYLAKEANNHFGIKCGGIWKGKSIAKDDDNPNDCFRVYDNVEDSYRDHSQFLLRKRYEKLFTLDKNDYKGWAYGLKEAGYATNSRYPELLIDLIERYDLKKFDSPEPVLDKEIREIRVEKMIENKSITDKDIPSIQIKSPVAMRVHEVKTSQTLYSISKLYGVSVDQIKKLNGLTSDNLYVGQLLVISK